MMKYLKPAVFTGISLAVFFILKAAFPKYTGMLFFFLAYLFLNGYLWTWVKKAKANTGPFLQKVITGLFWLPFLLVILAVAYGMFIPFVEWNIYLKTYVFSLILILLASTVFPLTALAAADLVRLFKRLSRKPLLKTMQMAPVQRSKPLILTGWFAGGVIFLFLLSGMIFWQYDFRLREQVIETEDLPAGFDGYRIIQISDMHLGSWTSKNKLRQAVETINSTHPDLIVFTGDMFNFCSAEGEGFEAILNKLRAPAGIFTILGNHDYGAYKKWENEAEVVENMNELVEFYHKIDWHLLRNEHIVLRKGSDSIALLGVENWGANRRFQQLGDIGKTIAGVDSLKFQLLLSHDPSHWSQVIRKQFPGIDLTLSGHTHGGQVGIELPWLHWSLAALIYPEWCGLYVATHGTSKQYLYVNQGIGTIGYAGRVGILPEITLLTLRKTR